MEVEGIKPNVLGVPDPHGSVGRARVDLLSDHGQAVDRTFMAFENTLEDTGLGIVGSNDAITASSEDCMKKLHLMTTNL